MKKKFFITIFILYIIFNIYAKQRIPVVINSQKKIFNKISKDIERVFPDNVEILFYDIHLINGDENIKKIINDNFYDIITSNQSKNKYKAKFERDIIKLYKNILGKNFKWIIEAVYKTTLKEFYN